MRAALGMLSVVICVAVTAGVSEAAPRGVTVFLDRDGRTIDHDGDQIVIPAFGGGDRAWNGIASCVARHFSPFQVEVVTRRPARGDFITAVIGGRASQLGLDDGSTNGVGPYNGRVIPNAIVHIFSKVGTGERDVQNLCAVTVHEVSHSLGLDHSFKCGDVMSYFLDRCGERRIMDVEAPCGESRSRRCANGERTQNSYRKLGAMVGFRTEPDPEPEPGAPDDDEDAYDPPAGDDGDDRAHDPWADAPGDDGSDADNVDADDHWNTRNEPQQRPEPRGRRRQPQHQCGGANAGNRRIYIIRRYR
ncbi:MAG TPA: matrixin family metalloprotease [Kofleriaceae bacterium]